MLNLPCKLLLIDDDNTLAYALQKYIATEAFELSWVRGATDGLQLARESSFDLILLNVRLPILDGFEVLRKIRFSHLTPVLLLSEQEDEFERAYGEQLGANDYLVKPFALRELMLRVRLEVKANKTKRGKYLRSTLNLGPLALDTASKSASFKHLVLALTDTEFKILEQLVIHHDHIVSKQDISHSVFQRPLRKHDTNIDMHMSNLRKKLDMHEAGKVLKTLRGNGYKIVC